MLPSPTLERAISLSTSNLTPTSPSSSFPSSVPLSSSLPSTLNVTFRAHFLESRCVSKLHIRFDFTRNAICSSNSTVCQHSENDPSNTKHVKHLSLILGIIFVSLLAAFVIGLVWFMRKKAPSYLHFSAAKEEGKTPKLDPYVLKQEGVDDGTLGSDQLERGVGGRIVSVLPPSMAETRSFVSSGTRGESRAPTPSTLGVKVAARTHQEESNGNGSNTESSGSHYEDQSNIGARLNNEGMRGAACGGVRFSRLGSSAGSRSGSETGHHLAPPLTVQNQSSPYSIRSTSPTPSSATAASAVSRATISKQTFFAKLKNLGPPRPRDPSSSSSDEEPHTSRPSPKPSIFANVVPTIKESSLGSLLGLSGDDSTKKKAAIGKPRPLMPSLGAYLARDHAQQIARAAASKDIVTRQDSDSGSSFTGGTAIIYSMKNSPLPIDIEPPLPPAHGSSVESLPNPYDLTTNEPDRVVTSTAEVAQLIRQRSTNSAMPAAPSHDDTLSSSSTGTITTGNIGEWRHPDSSSVQKMDTGDIPRRRIDFGKPTDEATNDMRPLSFIQEATSPLRHSRLRSDGSADSVVVSTAALAVRSPMTGARLVPSPKPSVVEEHPPTSPPDPIQSQTKDNTGLVHKTRLVQFVHERQYDGSSSGENDDRTYGIYSTYQGKREISQKAVVSGTPPEAWEKVTTAPTNPILGTTVTKSGSGLAEKVKMLREQSRIFHEQRVLEANTGLSGPIVSPVEAAFFDDPTLAAGIRYIQSLSSNDDVSMSQARESPGHETGLALGGYSDEHASNGSIAGKEQTVQSGSRSHISQTQPSFIAYEPSPPRTEKRTPPRIPLPAPPAMQYFDLSESSSDSSSSSSSSQGAGVVHHRPGLERILVGVNEPFNFPAPLHLPGSSPGQSSRVQVINHLKSAQKESNALTVVLWAEMEDGSPLPEWLGFDNQEAEFWGVPERGQQGGSLRVKVYLQEDGEVKEVGGFIIEIVGR